MTSLRCREVQIVERHEPTPTTEKTCSAATNLEVYCVWTRQRPVMTKVTAAIHVQKQRAYCDVTKFSIVWRRQATTIPKSTEVSCAPQTVVFVTLKIAQSWGTI